LIHNCLYEKNLIYIFSNWFISS